MTEIQVWGILTVIPQREPIHLRDVWNRTLVIIRDFQVCVNLGVWLMRVC